MELYLRITDIGESYFSKYEIDFFLNFHHVTLDTFSFHFLKEKKSNSSTDKFNFYLILNLFLYLFVLLSTCGKKHSLFIYIIENCFSWCPSVNALVEVNPRVDALS